MEAAIVAQSKIYIVDDDQSFGKSLKRLLNAKGFSADYFRSAQSFLEAVPPNGNGYVMVDIQMPECDGFRLMDIMNNLHYGLHVIVMTGRAQNDTADKALRKGAIGFLEKPFSEESLLELLNKGGTT